MILPRARTQNNALAVVRLILETVDPLLTTECQEMNGATLAQLSAGKEVVEQETRKAEVNDRLGLSSQGHRDTIRALERIKVEDLQTASQRDDFAQQIGDEVFGGGFGGRVSGSLANKVGEEVVAGTAIFGKKRENAIKEAYPGMVKAAGGAARTAAGDQKHKPEDWKYHWPLGGDGR